MAKPTNARLDDIHGPDSKPEMQLLWGILQRLQGNLRDDEAVTPSDSTDLPKIVAGDFDYATFLDCTAEATVTVRKFNGETAVYTVLPGDYRVVPRFDRVMATGTTLNGGTLRVGY